MHSISKLLAGSIVAFSAARTVAAGVKFAGVNIAGFDFGCSIDGTCLLSSVDPPLSQYGGSDGAGQMTHFTKTDGLNIFRLPVAWQYLVNNVLGGTLDATNFGKYDALVQACLKTGAHCIIDIHNYARWNTQVIGAPGGPKASDFSGLWGQLATKYKDEGSVVMGLMNEPHDIEKVPGLASWAASVQAAVTAIRKAGATTQMILLPGNGYTGASTFVSGGSAAVLAGVTNLDGSTDNLIFDVHQYLDSDYSGTSTTCTTNGISPAFEPLLKWLQDSKRQALLSETGGGSDSPSCLTDVCAALDFLNENSESFLGWVGWAAGSFDDTYVLSLTPTGGKDVALMTQCFAGNFGGGAGLGSSSASGSGSDSGAKLAAAPVPSPSLVNAASSPPAQTSTPAAVIGGSGGGGAAEGNTPSPSSPTSSAAAVYGGGSPAATTLCTFQSYQSYQPTGAAASAGAKASAYVVPQGWGCGSAGSVAGGQGSGQGGGQGSGQGGGQGSGQGGGQGSGQGGTQSNPQSSPQNSQSGAQSNPPASNSASYPVSQSGSRYTPPGRLNPSQPLWSNSSTSTSTSTSSSGSTSSDSDSSASLDNKSTAAQGGGTATEKGQEQQNGAEKGQGQGQQKKQQKKKKGDSCKVKGAMATGTARMRRGLRAGGG